MATDTTAASGTGGMQGGDKPLARPTGLFSNYISLSGFVIVGAAVLMLITAALFHLVSPFTNPYVDILTYLVLPGVLLTGMLIVPLGAGIRYLRFRARQRRKGAAAALPTIDLNEPKTRESILLFVVASMFLVLPVLVVSSYHAYHYTESTEFCGKTCHSVMEPQATAHMTSPHARVSCAECHIGSGADWFVKSKLSGVRQVFAVWADSFSRPIPPAIHHLRPARDTCEACHWPEKFFGSQLREKAYYSEDEHNTRRKLRMLLKVGGADPSMGRVEGIHMHMVLAGQIEYIATDEALQDIPWVRYVDNDGRELIYRSDGLTADDPPPPGIPRRIDCMDCHNRGAHPFLAPQSAVDLLMEAGHIDVTLPFIKYKSVRLLAEKHATAEQALARIREALVEYYDSNYPQIAAERGPAIERAIESVQDIYQRNVFPLMKADWRTYPDNSGHTNSAGCMRCHDGRHINQFGVPISSSCDVCHTFLNPVDDRPATYSEGIFHHTMPILHHENLQCHQCHTGGPLRGCRDCHATGDWLDERGRELFRQTDE